MKKKKILFYLIILCVLFSLCGCNIADGKAKKAAQEYAKAKYGQDAKVVKIKKNYKFTGPGGGLLPTGIESDESYNLTMKIENRQFDVCLISDGSEYIGYDNYEEELIKTEIVNDIESSLDIHCEDVFLSYGKIYDKYGANMIHDAYSNLESICENGKFAIIVATYDAINSEKIEEYATKYHIEDEKSILRIEILQYKDVIPWLSFSSFSEVNDPQYMVDWYTIWNGDVMHYGAEEE